MLTPELQKRIDDIIGQSDVVLFMKGEPESPACGFSARAVEILLENDIAFSSFDIYSDEDVRQGLKVYKNWPTYPQLYIKGKLIGGVDIMEEMNDEGEFKNILA